MTVEGMKLLATGPQSTEFYVLLGAALIVGIVLGLVISKMCCCKGRKCSQPKGRRSERPVRREIRSASNSGAETHAAIPAGSVEIYVGNLSYDLTEDELRKMFEAFGTVSSARIVTNHYNGKSKGFGFVVMPNRPEAEKAIADMEDKEFMGRKMRVNEAKNTIVEA